ncbi:hypothetical protein IEQ34_017515 [Dendrobium chrysotoxum]|uniref:Uncharacterized protein n=1 Tax=Dendrobium chrysotoxum TaxID=161865 RepID=A0AAV7G9U5_DENCH|nr:hypothetical protein IEQ34_017515 [Dendrobium chrysotoxum]
MITNDGFDNDFINLTLQGNGDNLETGLMDRSLVLVCESTHSDVPLDSTIHMASSALPVVGFVYENNVGVIDEMVGKDVLDPVVNNFHSHGASPLLNMPCFDQGDCEDINNMVANNFSLMPACDH